MRTKEEDFLHDLSGPIGGIELLLESIIPDIPPELGEQAVLLSNGLEKLKTMVRQRQKELAHG